MKIQCYDNYHKQKLLIKFDSLYDEINMRVFNSNYCNGKVHIEFEALTGEDPDPKRWSDLSDFKIIK